MNIEAGIIDKLDSVLKEHLEAQVITLVGERLGLNANDAMQVFYESPVAREIEVGSYGVQYLSPEYIVEEVIAAQTREDRI